MWTFTFECANQVPFDTLPRAAHFLAEMDRLAHPTPAHQVLSALEAHALDAGRQLLRDSLQGAAQQRIDRDEQKGGPHDAPRAPIPTASRVGTTANS